MNLTKPMLFSDVDFSKLLPLVDEFQMIHLKELVDKYLMQTLSVEKLVLADRYNLTDLREACLEHAKEHELYEEWMADYKSVNDQLVPLYDFRCQHCNTQQNISHQQAEEAGEQDEIDFTEPWDHSDITFIVEDQKVYANKMILSMSSPVMKAMFESDFKEKDAKEIELPGKEKRPFLNLMKAVHPPSQFKGNHKESYFCETSKYPNRGPYLPQPPRAYLQ